MKTSTSSSRLYEILDAKDEQLCLSQVQEFVMHVLSCERMAFTYRKKLVMSDRKLGCFLDGFFLSLDVYDSGKKYNPYIDLYYSSLLRIWEFWPCRYSANDEIPGTGVLAGEMLNRLVNSIRDLALKSDFRSNAKRLKKVVRRREREYFSYVDDLFERRSKVMVIRIDLYYKKPNFREDGLGNNEAADTKTLVADLHRMLSNKRHNSLFDNLEGYVFKLENGNDRGPHVHCLLFFNGSNVHRDDWYAEQVGIYWARVITKGTGWYNNCNSKKSGYFYRGIGLVDHRDGEMRSNLQRAISYFCKTDQLIERVDGLKVKSMRRGMSPAKRMKKKAGRPRQSQPLPAA